ncbi:nuclear envelope integral membrane protein 1-like isoform X2 [Babylonia areolata]|uniref:nuclear envelope integral membrane protein 1-like isoform X2 n=1 Tax=Babylonia areolata TaxID=304850 RepID=UPI003FCF97BF
MKCQKSKGSTIWWPSLYGIKLTVYDLKGVSIILFDVRFESILMADNFPFKMKPARILSFFFVISLLNAQSTTGTTCQKPECILLSPLSAHHVQIVVDGSRNGEKKLRIFCYTGQVKSLRSLWVNPRISIEGQEKTVPVDLSIYYGNNVSDVQNQSASVSLFGLNSWLLLKEEHSFAPFNLSCIGMTSVKSYSVSFRIRNPELWYIVYIVIGVVIFLCAPSWSRNIALHYTTGMTVGVLASVLLIMFLLTRLMPQRLKTVSYVVMAVSSSASLFMFQLVKTYLQDIIRDHWQVALGYVLVSALASFALVYRFGPVTDTRTLNLVCWAMQACGLVFIYQGTQIPEASVAIILLVITFHLCPKSVPQWLKNLRFRYFPPRHRFLTEEEYIRQGEVETRKALKELQEYCRSPDCNAWKVISRLQSPSRSSQFKTLVFVN